MEGMIWEAAMLAPKRGIDNLVAILDYNKMCLTSPIQEVISLEPIADKWKAFGWHVLEVNGHSISELYEALIEAKSTKGKPTFIVAHTIKGKGMPAIENTAASHAFGTFTSEMAEEIVRHLNAEGA
jgi:transketolase